MTSPQFVSKPPSSPALVTSLPQMAQAAPEIAQTSISSRSDLRAQLERADRLGHHLQYISPVAGVPPLQTRSESTPQEPTEEPTEESPIQSKESSSASGSPTQPGGTDSTPPLDPQNQPASEINTTPPSSLQAQLERAERLGHHFSQVSVLSPPRLQAQATDLWVQRLCSKCEQEKKGEDLGIQTQLTMGHPGDPYEVEADQVAAQVLSMPDPKPQEQHKIQTQPLRETISRVLQRSSKGISAVGSDFESRLSSARGGGSPLPDSVQSFMGSRIGADLSGVRVHTDAASVQMNREIGAQAFTHGEHVFYGAGKGPANDHLTAHELTHTIQQGAVIRAQATDQTVDGQTYEEIVAELRTLWLSELAAFQRQGYFAPPRLPQGVPPIELPPGVGQPGTQTQPAPGGSGPRLSPGGIALRIIGRTLGSIIGILLFPNSTAPPWMDEINQCTGRGYGSEEEYDWFVSLSPEQYDYVCGLYRTQTAPRDPEADEEGDSRTTPQTGPGQREEETCQVRPLGYHRGGDPTHDACADSAPPNVHPGSDVEVSHPRLGTKAFDALDPNDNLWEIKTGNYSNNSPFIQQQDRDAALRDIAVELPLARACGHGYKFGVSDPEFYRDLSAIVPDGVTLVLVNC